jgi:DNA-binding transcriptional regulator LsrR (DeoR family)
MSLSTSTISRIPKIQSGIKQGLTQEQIAEHCGVSRRTIIRDMQEWVNSGLFETWLKLEFVELYEYERVANPAIAFKALSQLMGKMVTRKAEIKAEYSEQTIHKTVIEIDPKDRILLESTARGYIKASHTRESASIH